MFWRMAYYIRQPNWHYVYTVSLIVYNNYNMVYYCEDLVVVFFQGISNIKDGGAL